MGYPELLFILSFVYSLAKPPTHKYNSFLTNGLILVTYFTLYILIEDIAVQFQSIQMLHTKSQLKFM